jgi:hypothetical protein
VYRSMNWLRMPLAVRPEKARVNPVGSVLVTASRWNITVLASGHNRKAVPSCPAAAPATSTATDDGCGRAAEGERDHADIDAAEQFELGVPVVIVVAANAERDPELVGQRLQEPGVVGGDAFVRRRVIGHEHIDAKRLRGQCPGLLDQAPELRGRDVAGGQEAEATGL